MKLNISKSISSSESVTSTEFRLNLPVLGFPAISNSNERGLTSSVGSTKKLNPETSKKDSVDRKKEYYSKKQKIGKLFLKEIPKTPKYNEDLNTVMPKK